MFQWLDSSYKQSEPTWKEAGYTTPGWYWWDETYACCYGPYKTQLLAEQAKNQYYLQLNAAEHFLHSLKGQCVRILTPANCEYLGWLVSWTDDQFLLTFNSPSVPTITRCPTFMVQRGPGTYIALAIPVEL